MSTIKNTNISNGNIMENKSLRQGSSVSTEMLWECKPVIEWQVQDVCNWACSLNNFSKRVIACLENEEIDGVVLLSLTEEDIRDFRYRLNYVLTFNELKKLWLAVRAMQQDEHIQFFGYPNRNKKTTTNIESPVFTGTIHTTHEISISPEFFKTAISLGYSFVVTWITSFVMVIVHERVPDMKRYPPLPDIFLDNVPHIPWAFHMCEITGTLLFIIWICVCIFHKYRMVLLRRFFALAGTVFLLRCVTMLITSLSVPGTHLQCNQKEYAVDDTDLTVLEALQQRVSRAYVIWSGLGMSIQGVRTCGDYMFSGHTVALTLLNFFITEYTPRSLYFLHTMTWLLNMFGIFFILAAHEHYSIDVFVAFYITSRLFLYYHTLANNHALMSHDSNRTRIWFPMFSYFESSVFGIIPNEYESPSTLLNNVYQYFVSVKNAFKIIATRLGMNRPPQPPHIPSSASKSLLTKLNKASKKTNSNSSTYQGTSCVQLNRIDSIIDANNDKIKSMSTESSAESGFTISPSIEKKIL